MGQNKSIVEVDTELSDLIDGFLSRRRAELVSIKEAIRTNNFSALKDIGHSLKGSAGGYGFHYIGEVASEIELAAQSKDIQKLNKCFADLEAHLNTLKVVFVNMD